MFDMWIVSICWSFCVSLNQFVFVAFDDFVFGLLFLISSQKQEIGCGKHFQDDLFGVNVSLSSVSRCCVSVCVWQLCLAVADLIVQMASWTNAVEDLINRSVTDALLLLHITVPNVIRVHLIHQVPTSQLCAFAEPLDRYLWWNTDKIFVKLQQLHCAAQCAHLYY